MSKWPEEQLDDNSKNDYCNTVVAYKRIEKLKDMEQGFSNQRKVTKIDSPKKFMTSLF